MVWPRLGKLWIRVSCAAVREHSPKRERNAELPECSVPGRSVDGACRRVRRTASAFHGCDTRATEQCQYVPGRPRAGRAYAGELSVLESRGNAECALECSRKPTLLSEFAVAEWGELA